ncbi:MAG TPA: GNAT family protein [Dehalococcoidia bacterium]|nr:GNAT family protein [Dehalococcoidia bacterium]
MAQAGVVAAGGAPGDEPIYVVEGELVALGPRRREQIDLWTRWMNNLEMTRTLGAPGVYTREAEEQFFEQKAKGSDTAVGFAIYERASGRPIGNTDLREISYKHGTATFGIMIGEPSCWNRGYGTEATRLVLDYAFHVLGLHNVLLTVFATNPRGVRAYEKAGFRQIGRRHGAYRLGQQRYDTIYMEALASDFQSPVLEHRLHAPQPPAER